MYVGGKMVLHNKESEYVDYYFKMYKKQNCNVSLLTTREVLRYTACVGGPLECNVDLPAAGKHSPNSKEMKNNFGEQKEYILLMNNERLATK